MYVSVCARTVTLRLLCMYQFVELKGSVFKKFEKHNLFQMSCSDVRERFHLLFLLTVVGVRNLTEFAWNMGLFNVLVCLFSIDTKLRCLRQHLLVGVGCT